MKLYLSSNKIPDLEAFVELVGKPLSETRFALIPNAKDNYADRLRAFKLGQAAAYFTSVGLLVDIVDLRRYSNSDDVYAALKNHDVIWGYGGNTFCLRYEMHRSGFDAAIKQLLAEGKVYGGESAGAIAVSKTLRGSEIADVPEAAEVIIWNGLGLVDKIIVPHADSVQYASYVPKMRDLYAGQPNYIELDDNQALVKNGHEERVVTGKKV